MKIVIALFALVAVANSYVIYSGYGYPMMYANMEFDGEPIKIEPEIIKYKMKPVEKEVNLAALGYVAITPGATHIAPLPYGLSSHHVNMAKAPGTK